MSSPSPVPTPTPTPTPTVPVPSPSPFPSPSPSLSLSPSPSPSASPSQSHVSILPERLLLVSIPNDQLSSVSSILLQLMFFAPKTGSRLFSYTNTHDESSIIMDESYVSLFPPNSLMFSPGIWRAICVNEGDDIIDQAGIVSSLAQPLAAAQVEIIYLSTYTSDLILVREEKVDDAYHRIHQNLSFLLNSKQKLQQKRKESLEIQSSPHITSSDISTKIEQWSIPETTSSIYPHHDRDGDGDGDDEKQHNDISLSLTPLPFQLTLLSFPVHHIATCAYAIFASLMNPTWNTSQDKKSLENAHFFSFTESGDTITMIVEQSCVSLFPSHIVTRHSNVWKALQVSSGEHGFDAAGLVSPLSSVLAAASISIYYLSTYKTDFTLVAAHDYSKSIHAINTSHIHVIMEEQETDQHHENT